ncbi:CLUMA_CG015111, isoform A [Clunio marinus]|uniref:CLUMA_CG015111, isoform A n=1 Tax=Clunio marinus TaxID=568069 RepID=A0A1J1IS24_9DIPT|nr:CLUMA_CG015111, isoform A [Clunio marinus]
MIIKMLEFFNDTKNTVLKLFRKFSNSNIKSPEKNENKATQSKAQKHRSIKISHVKDINNIKRNPFDDIDNDFPSSQHRRRLILKNCIRKRLYNNYEKQVNCPHDDGMIFTDNKIYVSLAARKSSVTSSIVDRNFLENLSARIIYPSSQEHKMNGFLKNYDFNYESPKRTIERFKHQTLEYKMMAESLSGIFEKVKIPSTRISSNDHQHTSHRVEKFSSFGSKYHSPAIIDCTQGDFDDEEWENFLKLRKFEKEGPSSKNNSISLSDIENLNRLKKLIQSDTKNEYESQFNEEKYDNSFNEQLEQNTYAIFSTKYLQAEL